MARNGSGNYSLPSGNPVVPSTVISSTWANNTLSDIATALTQSIANDGQTTPVANLPMATFRHTNVGNAQARSDYAAAGQVQDSVLQWLTTIAGTDTITASLTPSPGAYTAGQVFRFVPAGTNTTSTVTLNINGLGAKAITKNGTVALSPGDLVGGTIFEVIYDGTQFQLKTAAATATSTSAYGVRGLVGANNSGTPNTKFDLAADAVTLRSTNGTPDVTRFGTGTITNDTGLAGSAANGRDQAGAFSASNWIHFYFIWNGTTLATLSSLVAPATGPTMPTGYTHWAYAGAVFYNATPVLGQTRFRGCLASYPTIQTALASGSATTETNISLTGLVPPNALNIQVNVRAQYADTTNTANDLLIKVVSGATFNDMPIVAQVNSVGINISGVSFMAPNIGQNLIYQWNTANGTVRTAAISVQGYTMPNGGE
jgi:hypothetical protein